MFSLSRFGQSLTTTAITFFLALFLVVTLPTQNVARPHCHAFDRFCTNDSLTTPQDLSAVPPDSGQMPMRPQPSR